MKTNNEISIINPDRFTNKRLFVSEIAKDIQYIPLSNSFPVGNIYRIEKFCNLFFISLGRAEQLAVFDANGQYRNDIGKVGRGPNEYLRTTNYSVDEYNKSIVVLDRNRLLYYMFNGDMTKTVNLDSFDMKFDDLRFLKNKTFLFEDNYGKTIYDWIILDENGKCIFNKKNSIDSFDSRLSLGSNISLFDNKIHYMNAYNDTIFEIAETFFSPAYIFASGDFRIPAKFFRAREMANYFVTAFITESKSYFFIFATYLGKQILCYHQKNKDDFYIVDELKILPEGELLNPGITNDIDAGPKFSPLFYFEEDGSEYFVDWIYPYKLKAHVASDDFKNATPKYPEKKKELEQLANSLDENDNPVLMLVKLKE